ncbi:MAG: hypothetical protein IKO49_05240 [Bacilli bacterium]|nr:hypothetical protein [Bacilli bacterium]
MFVISNNCLNGFFYRDVIKQEYNHPFFWGYFLTDFLEFIKHYDEVNLNNYEIKHDENWNFYLIIDGKYKYNLLHYKFDKNVNFKKIHENVYSNRIWEYIYIKYEERLKRIPNENPIFVIHWFPKDGFTKELLEKFIKEKLHYKIIIFSPYNISTTNKNINLVYTKIAETGDNVTLSKMLENVI